MQEFKLKDYILKDTIAAIATFPSKSALGVIKISGNKAIAILAKVFIPKRKKDIKKVKTFTLHYGWIRQSVNNRSKKDKDIIIDEVLVSVMRAPNSYTTEDVVEISSHGGIVSVNKILEIVLNEGARLALPGEFTYRALIKGR
ncbi:MAG: tRNA uridine-5-carboxymethylaminomethyl(34) synthesis GTPase MnmE, partial [Candidatus Omnitrophica bacterium]|nr:tRNA uridine-5-carboxymethylaminomethyl(34) synthesis GTPase MnmE [Candidatus Omnitrophota bacterium]